MAPCNPYISSIKPDVVRAEWPKVRVVSTPQEAFGDSSPQLDSGENWGQDNQLGTLTVYHQAWTQTSAAPNQAGNYLQYYAALRDHLNGVAEAPQSRRARWRRPYNC